MNKDFSGISKNTVWTYLFGILIGTGVTLISMLLLAAVMLFGQLSREYAVPFATISVALGTFFAARFAAKRIGSKGYLVGLIIGGAVFLVIMLISLAVNRDAIGTNTLFHLVIIVLSSLVGGISGVNKKSNRII